MIFNVDFEVFKRVITESNTGLIFLKKEMFITEQEDPGDPKIERIIATYELYTYSDGALVKTGKDFFDLKEAIMFEETFLKGFKIIPVISVEDKDIILTIAKG